MSDSTRRIVETDWANANAPGVAAPAQSVQDNGYGGVTPPFEEHNWLFQLMTNMLQNAEQYGIMQWRSLTPYAENGLAFGSDGKIWQSQGAANTGNDPVLDNGTNWKVWLQTTANPFINRALFKDEKADGVDGGTFTSGAWRTRDLQEVYNTISGSSIVANVITLPIGTYIFKGSAPCARSATENPIRHQAAIRNVTAASFPALGTSEYINSNPTAGAQTRSFISSPPVAIVIESNFEMQHRIDATESVTGFGISAGFGVGEVYSELEIWKLD